MEEESIKGCHGEAARGSRHPCTLSNSNSNSHLQQYKHNMSTQHTGPDLHHTYTHTHCAGTSTCADQMWGQEICVASTAATVCACHSPPIFNTVLLLPAAAGHTLVLHPSINAQTHVPCMCAPPVNQCANTRTLHLLHASKVHAHTHTATETYTHKVSGHALLSAAGTGCARSAMHAQGTPTPYTCVCRDGLI